MCAFHGRQLQASEQGQCCACAALGSSGLPGTAALPLRERLAAATRLVEQRNSLAPQAPGVHGATQAYYNAGGHAAAAPVQQHRPVAAAFGGHVFMGGLAAAGPQMVTSVPVQPGWGSAAQQPAQPPAGRPGAVPPSTPFITCS